MALTIRPAPAAGGGGGGWWYEATVHQLKLATQVQLNTMSYPSNGLKDAASKDASPPFHSPNTTTQSAPGSRPAAPQVSSSRTTSGQTQGASDEHRVPVIAYSNASGNVTSGSHKAGSGCDGPHSEEQSRETPPGASLLERYGGHDLPPRPPPSTAEQDLDPELCRMYRWKAKEQFPGARKTVKDRWVAASVRRHEVQHAEAGPSTTRPSPHSDHTEAPTYSIPHQKGIASHIRSSTFDLSSEETRAPRSLRPTQSDLVRYDEDAADEGSGEDGSLYGTDGGRSE